MNLKLLRGYVLAVLTVLILGAAAVLLVNNIGKGEDWQLQVYWRPVALRPAAWLILAGLGGVIVWWTVRRLLPRAIADIRSARRARRSAQSPQVQRDKTEHEGEKKPG